MAWADIRGQDVARRVLQAHLSRGTVAPAYLFVGPAGVGKRLTAFELAKTLLCERTSATACDQCGSCTRMMRRSHPDFFELLPQGPSQAIPIDEVRRVMARIVLRPFLGRACAVVIDGADRLTEEAANSLLKTLEEPPAHTHIVALTTRLSDCLPTIVSRCQTIRFQRLSPPLLEELLGRLQPCDPSVARQASRLAQGSLTHAKELAKQWATYQTMWAQLASPTGERWVRWTAPTDREELAQWLQGSIGWLRDVAVACVAEETLISHRDLVASIRHQAQRVDGDRCLEGALSCIRLWLSLTEQFVSPRLVGTLLRERWLEVMGNKNV